MKNHILIGLLSLLMLTYTFGLILAFPSSGTGAVNVYGKEYVEKYFKTDEIMQVHIQMEENDWKSMTENAIKEEFVEASVTINGELFPLVKVRPKGNSSLRSVANGKNKRFSFKLNFDSLVKNRTMAGLSQLNLNNGFSDPSYMREYLSYRIFEKMRVPVPACSFAKVFVNEEYFGLFLAVESILEPYLERNFGDLTGTLYKSTGNTLQYTGNSATDTRGMEVKVNKKHSDTSALMAMLKALNQGGDIEKHLDVDGALRYLAVSTALVNFDSYQGNFGHNYYLYELNGKFTILPWDLNMSFGGFNFGGSFSKVFIDEPTQGSVAQRPLVAKLLENESYRETHHTYLKEVAEKYLSEDYLQREIDQVSQLIAEEVKNDPSAFYTYEQFQNNIQPLSEQISLDQSINKSNDSDLASGDFRMASRSVPNLLTLASAMQDTITQQLSGEQPSTNNGEGMGGGMGGMGGRGFGEGKEGRPEGGMERMPGQMAPPGMEGRMPVDRKLMEELRQEIQASGGIITEDIKKKALDAGLPEEMLEMMANAPGPMPGMEGMPGGPPEGGFPPEGEGGMPRGPGSQRQQMSGTTQSNNIWLLIISGLLLLLMVLSVKLFHRRK